MPTQRVGLLFMRCRKPPRFHVSNSVYFLTFVTRHRRKVFDSNDLRQYLVDELEFSSCKYDVPIVAYVILLDHLHLMLEVKKVDQMSRFLNGYKTFTSKKLRKQLKLDDSVWQWGTWDHMIRESAENKDFHNHLDYLHYNPVKHGLASSPCKYEFSSFMKFVDDGTYDGRWGADYVEDKEIASKVEWL